MIKNFVSKSVFQRLLSAVITLSLAALPMSSAQAVSSMRELSWQAIVSGGFGDANNTDISALEEFKGKLYAEATNYFDGATIWRSANGKTWAQVTAPGFDSAYGANNPFVFDMVVFKRGVS